MLIVNPAFGQATGGDERRALNTVDWSTVPVALVSNSKPNARELLEGMQAQLAGVRNVDNFGYVSKMSASQPAPQQVIDEVADGYQAAVLAIAD